MSDCVAYQTIWSFLQSQLDALREPEQIRTGLLKYIYPRTC